MTRPLKGRVALVTGTRPGRPPTAAALAIAGADIGIVDLDQGKVTATIEAITSGMA